jgi:hypothetical protein
MTTFLALMTSLPTGNSTLRMRVWRALRSTGCGVLRDGVYLLPVEAPQAAALADAESEIKAAGGFAMTVELKLKNAAQLEHVRKLFDRSTEYGAIVERIAAAKSTLPKLGKRRADTLVQRLRRSYDALAETDFYRGPAHQQAGAAVSALEQDAHRLLTGGEPRAAKGRVRRLDPKAFRGRVWATRKDLWVDRLASAWLIKRFIDKSARFVWIDRPRDRPRGAVGFDFDGADFTHVDGRVSFEVLLASFGLDDDPALAAIGQAVHFLDTGGIPVADAKGVETILRGLKKNAAGDTELAAQAARVFDSLYSGYAQQRAG